MTKRIFITATNTDIGKTYVTKLLIRELTKLGHRVGVFKPIETGVSDLPIDGSALLTVIKIHNKAMEHLTVNDLVPIQYTLPAAPFVASGGEATDMNRIDKALEKIEALCDIVLIEGAGGLMVPIDNELMMIDLIDHFKAKALLVTHCRLGCINDTLLSLQALKNADIKYEWAFNCREDDSTFSEVSEPYFLDKDIRTYHISRDLNDLAKALIKA